MHVNIRTVECRVLYAVVLYMGYLRSNENKVDDMLILKLLIFTLCPSLQPSHYVNLVTLWKTGKRMSLKLPSLNDKFSYFPVLQKAVCLISVEAQESEVTSRPKRKVNEDLSLDKPLQVIYIESQQISL
jgi:hypothetical protein